MRHRLQNGKSDARSGKASEGNADSPTPIRSLLDRIMRDRALCLGEVNPANVSMTATSVPPSAEQNLNCASPTSETLPLTRVKKTGGSAIKRNNSVDESRHSFSKAVASLSDTELLDTVFYLLVADTWNKGFADYLAREFSWQINLAMSKHDPSGRLFERAYI